ncbi:MAG TPA: type IV toxin-antitoxin system AbiEi family antitoxin [Gammaproteobacteria bacterium]|jgi:predicted transcriptional regulator of viral defense system|nr:type IV toxin-antitoxin system AbiEi family antitoxin [Gammaproteobacteria bacterium]
MHTNNNETLKTLGPVAGRLVATLYSRNRPIFHFQEAAEILDGRPATASKVLFRLINNGVVTRLKSRTFRLVPFELGFEREDLGNPYLVARELVLGGHKGMKERYYLSYGSAFDLHQMLTQPQFIIYVSSPRMMRSQIIQGTEFRFVRCKTKDLFGLTEIWVDKNEKVYISDLERTLLDGLKQPAYCGGLLEVAKGFSIKREAIDPQKLIDYAIKLDIGAVNRRLGYLMELYNIGLRIHWEFLQTTLTPTYHLLDPELPAEGHHIAKWRLRLNVSQEELLASRGT